MARKVLVTELGLTLSPDAVSWMERFAHEHNLQDNPDEMDMYFRQLAAGLTGRGDGFGELQEREADASPSRSLSS